MKNRAFLIPGVLVAGCLAGLAAAPKPNGEPPRVLSVLKEGQRIALKDLGTVFQISAVPGVDLGHRVKEIGGDYLVVEDIAGITESRIPIYRIKAVTVIRPKGETK